MNTRKWLSRYDLRYPRSLVYMLQASEYHLGDYLTWLRRVKDFRRVEYRKHLEPTHKAVLLQVFLWAVIAAALVKLAVAYTLAQTGGWLGWWFAGAVVALLIGPFLLAYVVLIPLWLGQALIQRPQERRLNAGTARTLAAHPATKIAIAGSYGKTTMKDILATVLSAGYQTGEVKATPGNANTPIGISRFAATLTGKEKVLIFELGEYYPGDIKALCELVHPDLGVITGINEAHLSKFKTLDRTVGTIFELADYLGDRPVYINGESEIAANAAKPAATKPASAHPKPTPGQSGHILYAEAGAGDWRTSDIKTGLDGTSFTLTRTPGHSPNAGASHAANRTAASHFKVHSALLGRHQVGPLAAAAVIAVSLGAEPKAIERGLAAARPFEHRLQPHTDASGAVTIDDSYNGNPDGVRAAVNFLAGLTGRRRTYVTPGLVEMGARTEAVHREIGRQLAGAAIERVILIRNSATPHIAAGLESAGFTGQLLWYDDAPACFAALPSLTAAGDVVLIQNDWPDAYA